MASIGLFYFLPMSLNAQLPDLNCNTKKLSGDTSCNPDLLSMNETDPVVLRIYLHVIRTDQGFGGATVTQLENSLSILTSDYAEYDISFVPQKIKDIQSDFVRLMITEMDELPNYAEIKDLLAQDQTNEAIRTKYAIAIAENQLADADALLQQYEPVDENDAWSELQETLLGVDSQEGGLENLSETKKSTLESFIANNKREKHIAKAILAYVNDEEYIEEIVLPDPNKSSNVKKELISLSELPELGVFPNPANTEVFFTYELPEDIPNIVIRIYSVKGELVFNEDLSGNKGIYRVDVSGLTQGNYIAEIRANGIVVLNNKFVKL